MNRRLAFVGTLAAVAALSGCAGMTDQQQRMATGATIGGLAVGAATGSWGWGAAGAAAGAATGYIVQAQRDSQRRREQEAFERGRQEGMAQ
jgi:osmotically inducible lipoprotein OsmB